MNKAKGVSLQMPFINGINTIKFKYEKINFCHFIKFYSNYMRLIQRQCCSPLL